jgi:enoyl-[acyl-carrier protein] reductase I
MNLKGKNALVMGVANSHSIAYSIARELSQRGVNVALSYAGPILAKRVLPIADELGVKICLECDVSKDYSVQKLISTLREHWDSLDIVVHSVAYAPTEELNKPFHLTSRAGFATAMDVSVYSLIATLREADAFLSTGAAVLTLSYYGAQKVAPNYGVMGVAKAALESSVRYLAHSLGPRNIRVNAISAGPVRTLSSAAIHGISQLQRRVEKSSPLERNIDVTDVAKTALYLLSDLSSGVTGEVLFVDAGMNIMAY